MQPNEEKIVETKTCKYCGIKFNITDNDLEFYDKVSPVFNGTKYSIPTPNLCPDCRQQRRLSFRNERKLYKRQCSASGKNIISVFSSDKNFPVYSSDEWWSDRWNPLDYGREFDFSRSFFDQMNDLIKDVPKLSIVNFNSENSDYTNICADNKDCYLIVESSNNEKSFYSYWLQLSNDIMDCAYINNSNQCYECTNLENCYNLKYSNRCIDCKDSYYLKDSYGCSDCFACFGLEGKKYHLFNKEVSEDEYKNNLEIFLHGNQDQKKKLNQQIQDFFGKLGKREPRIIGSENCTGDFIVNCKDCINVFEGNNAENCRYSTDVWREARDIMDGNTCGRTASKCYEITNVAVDVSGMRFCAMCWINNSECLYSFYCANSSNLFGCTGIHSPHSYCILNKQYTKEEYEELVPKIIEHMKTTGEWGEFFPSSISPFGYNETVAQEYYPLTKEEAENKGFKWSIYENPTPQVSKTIPADKLPENIKDIPDDILNWAIICEITNKPFRIIKQELDFYRKHNLPIPRRHPDQRHIDRMKVKYI